MLTSPQLVDHLRVNVLYEHARDVLNGLCGIVSLHVSDDAPNVDVRVHVLNGRTRIAVFQLAKRALYDRRNGVNMMMVMTLVRSRLDGVAARLASRHTATGALA